MRSSRRTARAAGAACLARGARTHCTSSLRARLTRIQTLALTLTLSLSLTLTLALALTLTLTPTLTLALNPTTQPSPNPNSGESYLLMFLSEKWAFVAVRCSDEQVLQPTY